MRREPSRGVTEGEGMIARTLDGPVQLSEKIILEDFGARPGQPSRLAGWWRP